MEELDIFDDQQYWERWGEFNPDEAEMGEPPFSPSPDEVLNACAANLADAQANLTAAAVVLNKFAAIIEAQVEALRR